MFHLCVIIAAVDYLIGWLIGEIKERSVYVPGYDYSTFELYGLWCLMQAFNLINSTDFVHTPICGVNCTFDSIKSCLESTFTVVCICFF